MTLSDAQRRLLQLLGFVLAIPIGLIALWFAYGAYIDWRYVTPWQKIGRGDTEDRVVKLLGQPHRVEHEDSPKATWESAHHEEWYDAESVKRYRYIPFSITGEEYDVAFDASGHAVSKFHITSP